MRTSQWFLVAIFLIGIGIWFIRLDNIAEGVCGVAGIPPDAVISAKQLEKIPEGFLEDDLEPLTAPKQLTTEEWFKTGGAQHVDRIGLWCVNTEIYDPFIWLLIPLGIVFLICGVIETASEDRRKKR